MIKEGMSNSHKYDIQVDWGDCDPAGIVFYPNFYRWMDRGFWLLFGSRGLTLDVLRERYKALGGPLVDTGATFLQPVQPGEILTVSSLIQHWGTKSFASNTSSRAKHYLLPLDSKYASGVPWEKTGPSPPPLYRTKLRAFSKTTSRTPFRRRKIVASPNPQRCSLRHRPVLKAPLQQECP